MNRPCKANISVCIMDMRLTGFLFALAGHILYNTDSDDLFKCMHFTFKLQIWLTFLKINVFKVKININLG